MSGCCGECCRAEQLWDCHMLPHNPNSACSRLQVICPDPWKAGAKNTNVKGGRCAEMQWVHFLLPHCLCNATSVSCNESAACCVSLPHCVCCRAVQEAEREPATDEAHQVRCSQTQPQCRLRQCKHLSQWRPPIRIALAQRFTAASL